MDLLRVHSAAARVAPDVPIHGHTWIMSLDTSGSIHNTQSSWMEIAMHSMEITSRIDSVAL